jgi:hypothetical protein
LASATASSVSQIDLTWTHNASSCDVLIIRNASDSWTAPVNGTAYTAGNTLGTGTVVAKLSRPGVYTNSFNNTSLSSNTTYYYKFYSEYYGGYSSGTVLSATTQTVTAVNTVSNDDNYSNVYASSNRKIVVEISKMADVKVFDFSGKLLVNTKIEKSAELTMQHAGVYIVKVGTKVTKVVIK